MSLGAAILIVLAFLGLIIWSTVAGSTLHEGDRGLPVYRQRILVGRYFSRNYAPRWQIWLVWAIFPLILCGIALLNP